MNDDKAPKEAYINGDQSTIESQDSNEPLIERALPVIEPRSDILSDEDSDDEGIVSISVSPVLSSRRHVTYRGYSHNSIHSTAAVLKWGGNFMLLLQEV